jgi:hypothetical protein
VTAVEQTEAFPAASVARAVYDVVESSATFVGSRPAPPKVPAGPDATDPPVQSAVA